MKILIIYASNSGSTYHVAMILSQWLKNNGFETTVKKAHETEYSDLEAHDMILMGSCTWDYEQLEGQYHFTFANLASKLAGKKLINKTFAVFSCGDSSYISFGFAADKLQQLVTKLGGRLSIFPLRVDRFYSDQPVKTQQVVAWVSELATRLTSIKQNG